MFPGSLELNEFLVFFFILVMPHQQDLEKLAENMGKTIEDIQEINDPVMPPRILQNVHGYFELASERGKESGLKSKGAGLSTRLDLCHQWDSETVAPATFLNEEGEPEGMQFFKQNQIYLI